jgi:hypothetical protein
LAQPEQEPVATVQCIKGITIDPVTGNVGIGTPAAQPAPAQPEQESVAWRNAAIRLGEELSSVGPDGYYNMTAAQWLDWALEQQPRGKNSLTTPPAAQRTWVGLTDAELVDMHATLMVKLQGCYETKDLYRAIEQRLKDKNT